MQIFKYPAEEAEKQTPAMSSLNLGQEKWHTFKMLVFLQYMDTPVQKQYLCRNIRACKEKTLTKSREHTSTLCNIFLQFSCKDEFYLLAHLPVVALFSQ